MKTWLDSLDKGEQDRRRRFETEFKAQLNSFRAMPLGNARHISEHRTGFPPVTVTISGRFCGLFAFIPTRGHSERRASFAGQQVGGLTAR